MWRVCGRWGCLEALVIFFFNDTATTEIYTLSLHDALPIYRRELERWSARHSELPRDPPTDRKSTRLNSSHEWISYAVFCLKKKKQQPPRAVGLKKALHRIIRRDS